MEWLPFFSDPDPWQIFVGVLILILGPTALLSEKVVHEKFGAVGAFFRWFSGQKRKRLEEKQDVTERHIRDLRKEIARVDEARERDVQDLQEQVDIFKTSTTKQHRYIVWATDIFRGIEIWAAERGLTLPPPPFKTYSEWLEEEGE